MTCHVRSAGEEARKTRSMKDPDDCAVDTITVLLLTLCLLGDRMGVRRDKKISRKGRWDAESNGRMVIRRKGSKK